MTDPDRAAAPAKRRPPLAGVRILAVSQFGAGPFGTQVLADLGAEVVRIEDPGVGGDVASYVPPFEGVADSPYFQSFNRGKRSIAINLRHPDGQAVFHDLVRISDAVFNNVRGDLPGKLGTLNRDWVADRTPDSAHQTLVPAQNFPTRDGWIVVFCNKDKFWRDLVESLDMHDLAEDPRFATFPARLANRATLAAALGERFATRTTAEWLERLRGRVPCAPVNDVRAALADEQVRAREMIVEVDHSEFGRLREARGPIRTEGEIRVPARAPKLGEHTEAILSEMLRYSDGAIARLRAAGAIG